MPADMASHRARCQGRAEPQPNDRWLPAERAAERVGEEDLRKLVDSGIIRRRGSNVLLRDVEQVVSIMEMVDRCSR
jgi:hypothetical protein